MIATGKNTMLIHKTKPQSRRARREPRVVERALAGDESEMRSNRIPVFFCFALAAALPLGIIPSKMSEEMT